MKYKVKINCNYVTEVEADNEEQAQDEAMSELMADPDFDYEVEEASGLIEINVPEKVAKNIHTAKDLNDYYAFMERFESERSEDFVYNFPVEHQDKIDALMPDLTYTPGEYDLTNIERMFEERFHVDAEETKA